MANLAKISSNEVPIKARQLLTKAILKEFKRLKLDPNIPAEKDQLSNVIRDSKEIKAIIQKHAPNFRIKALNDFLRIRMDNPKGKNLIQLTPQGTDKGNIRRAALSRQPGGEEWSRKGSLEELLKKEKTKEFLNSPIIQTYDDAVVQKFFHEIHRDTVNLKNELRRANQGLDKNDPNKKSWGHLNRLSHSVDTPENVFIELLSENIAKGDNYMENPDSMLAIGNPTKEDVGWLKNWERVFLSWADKKENGGTGLLPQRGQYDSALEKQFRDIGGDQYNKLSDKEKNKRYNQIQDLIHSEEQKKNYNPANQTYSLDPNASNLTVKPPTLQEVRQQRRLGNVWDRKLQQFVTKPTAVPGTHFNRNMNLLGKGSEMVLEELPGSKEVIGAARTAIDLGKGDFVSAASNIIGSTSTTTGPFRSEYKAIQRDIKLDPITSTLVDLGSNSF